MASMDESVWSNLVGENIPISSFLQSMGVKVKQQNHAVRLQAALENFDECYIDMMDFLTQILPIAKQHFGKHDALLLPKTPSKSRSRKYKDKLNDKEGSMSEEDKENTQSNTLTKLDLHSPKERYKRVTRNTAKAVENERTSKHKKKLSNQPASDKPHVAFTPKNLKRSVSTPGLKHSPKRPKSADNLCMGIEKVVEQQLSEQKLDPCPVVLSERNGEPERKCGEIVEQKSGLVVAENIDNDMVEHNNVETVKNDLGRIESGEDEEDADMETNQGRTKSVKEEEDAVMETNQGQSKCEKEEEDADMETNQKIIESEKAEEDVPVDMEINLCVVEEPMLCNTVEAETCEDNKHEESNEQKQELNVEKSMGDNGNNCNSTYVRQTESPSECHNVVVRESVHIVETDNSDDKTDLLARNCADITEIVTESEEGLDKETTQGNGESCSQNDTKAAPDIVPWVRRSKRSSRRISKFSMEKEIKCRSSQRLSSRASRLSNCLNKTPPANVPAEGKISSDESSPDFKLHTLMATFSEHFSINSEEEPQVKGVGPSSSTPDLQTENKPKRSLRSSTKMSLNKDHDRSLKSSSSDDAVENKPRRSLRIRSSTKISLNKDHDRSLKSSSSDDAVELNVGKVAGIVKKMNRNTKVFEEQTSVVKTPNGQRKIKRLGSSNIKGSTKKPSNIVGGNIKSFIRRPSTKKLDVSEIVRLKKLELQRKEEKERERTHQAELRRKCLAEEQKRRREEKQKKVAETKAAREKEEEEKKQRQVEEKKQLLQALEQAKKKKEQEEEIKKKQREQRKKDADARRLKDNEERLKRLHEKEEEDRHYREMLKRKQEHDEQERKERVREEKRIQEQKQRDRQREQQEDRDRKLREIKDKEQKHMIDKENCAEARALAEKKNREEKEEKDKNQKEQEDRENKRIGQLIKEKMQQDKKMWEEKREKEEKARKEREEQKKLREANKVNPSLYTSALNKSINQVKSVDSYEMTPPRARIRKPSTKDNYDISDILSDDSTDDEDHPRKKVPTWAQGTTLKDALLNQDEPRRIFEAEVGPYKPPDLDKIFRKKRKRFYHRTSSAQWLSPLLKPKDQSFNSVKIEL